ncbi:hypothetical protein [Microbulbifer sp. SSSA002]|uniref:hypothetical protein n=1 Tax=Microbulbifer sp. SSSA002 TaxID=3243376 RepID=UPI004039FCFB
MGQLALTDKKKLGDNFIQLFTIGQMVQDGTLISLKDFLGYQADFYQVIITILIAINAIIAGVSFFFIKGRSEEKAETAAVKHMKSESFAEILRNHTKKTVVDTLDDDTLRDFDKVLSENRKLTEELESLTSDYASLRAQIATVSSRMAELDTEEVEGGELEIKE